MAKGEPLSRHQQKIVNRYYDHKDTIMATKLAEIVTELYLCESEKKETTLWNRATKALESTNLKAAEIDQVISSKDVEGLALLVKKLNS